MSGRRLWTLVRREVLATFRDPFTMSILVAAPLAALLLFGFILSTEVRNLGLGVVDADGSRTSRLLVEEIGAQKAFTVTRYSSRHALSRALVSGEVSAGLVIPPGLESGLGGAGSGRRPPEIEVVYDGGESVLAGNAEAFLRSLLGANLPQLLASAGATAPPPRTAGAIEVAGRALFNPRLDGRPFMVAGTFGFVLSFLTTLLTAVSVVNEKLSGTFEQLQVTPATPVEIVLGKILPMGAVFALDVVLMVVVAGLVIGVWPQGSALFFITVSSFYVLISLALGLIFSATSATAAEAVQKTVLFSVPLVQLSGFVFPVRNMPAVVRWIAQLFPATHYIRVSRAIYLRAAGPLALAPDLLLLAFFGALVIAYAMRTLEART